MADTKITALDALTAADPANDVLPIVDVNDPFMAASGTTKKISINNILGASGTATLASATITGDLTVRTNKLAVTSTGVAVGATSAAYPLDVTGIINTNSDAYVQGGRLALYRPAGSSYIDIASGQDLVFRGGLTTVSGTGASDLMRLNSTGLGVGTTPSYKLHVFGASPALTIQDSSSAAGGVGGTMNFISYTSGTSGANIEAQIKGVKSSASSAGELLFFTSDSSGNSQQRFMVDGTGNVGIGVTPSAWGSGFRYVQAGPGCAYGTNGSVDRTDVAANWYYNGGDKYINATGKASIFQQSGGAFFWLSTNTSSGGAGSAMTLNTNMTLDASGNLLVAGTSAYIRAGGRTQIVGGSVVDINTVGNNVGIAFGGASSILPCDGSSTTTDGVANFGSASKRWNTIYASTGTINTSDQNEKQDIADLGDAEKRVAGKIKSLVKKYRFKDAVASKGENARIHVGWIAQDVQNAFSSEGLDASKYGVFCSDTWEENGVQKTRLGLRYDEVIAFVVSAI